MLHLYKEQTKCLVALDSIIFGFDGDELKILLVKRGIEETDDTWSLMGGWLQPTESLDQAAARILMELTGLNNIYLEQIGAYGRPDRDPVQRTVSVTYFALINVQDYTDEISEKYQAKWFSLHELPHLLFDHAHLLNRAIEKLRNKAAFHPIGFELLPEKFTLPQLQKLYEAIYDSNFDKRNFSRKIMSTGLLIKLDEKQRGFSKKGAYYFRLDKEKYKASMHDYHNLITNFDILP